MVSQKENPPETKLNVTEDCDLIEEFRIAVTKKLNELKKKKKASQI